MEIEFKSDEEFQRLIVALAQEIVDANIHWQLLSDLKNEIEWFSHEYNHSPAFWTLTFQAHLDATIFRLIRIYDSHSSSLSLKNLLDTILVNLEIFEAEKFKERLKNNPFVQSLSENARKPDVQQLNKDLDIVSNKNPAVKKLIIWRNNLFAHKSSKNAVNNYNIASDFPLGENEIEQLLIDSKNIINRYSYLFRASSYSTKIIGHDDYKFVLKSIRANIKQLHREAIEKIKEYDRNENTQP